MHSDDIRILAVAFSHIIMLGDFSLPLTVTETKKVFDPEFRISFKNLIVSFLVLGLTTPNTYKKYLQ